MKFEIIKLIFQIIGIIATMALAVAVVNHVAEWFKSFLLIRQSLSDSRNEHQNAIRDLSQRVEFLERCERERTKEENNAREIREMMAMQERTIQNPPPVAPYQQ